MASSHPPDSPALVATYTNHWPALVNRTQPTAHRKLKRDSRAWPPMVSPTGPADFPQQGSTQNPPPAMDPVSQGTGFLFSATKPSFASVVGRSSGSSRFPELDLAARQYGVKDGVPSITFTSAEYQAATQRFAHTLIAKFQVGRPPFEVVKNTMLASWKIEGKITISNNWDDRHLVIILDLEKDVNEVLTSPLRKIGHTMFRLFRWSSDYNPKKENPTVTKWLRFPGLPMQFFDRAILRSIVSSFAHFLDSDTKTKDMEGLTFARACVELDVTKSVPQSVWINIPGDRGFYQEILVEGGLKYCPKCKMHGHDITNCRKVSKNVVNQEPVTHGNKVSIPPRAQPKKDNVLMKGDNTINFVSKIGMNDLVREQEWQVVNRKKKSKEQREDVVQSGEDTFSKKVESNSQKVQRDSSISVVRDNEVEEVHNRQKSELPMVIYDSGFPQQVCKIVEEKNFPVEENGELPNNIQEDMDGGIHSPIVESSVVPNADQYCSSNHKSSSGDCLYYYEPLGGMNTARTIMLHMNDLYKDDNTSQIIEESAKVTGQFQQEGSSLPMEESERDCEDIGVMHNGDKNCDQVGDRSLMPTITSQQRSRHRKKSRSSTRFCPKKKDATFVYS